MKSNAVAIESYATIEPETLYRRARSLVPFLASLADAHAKAQRVSDEAINAMREQQLFKILQPRRWGGFEMSPSVFYEVQTILAEGDMASAWCFGILGVHSWHLALFDDKAQADVWGDDDGVLIASTYMPVGKLQPVEGGYRMNGRWRFSSGCDNGDWIMLGALVPTAGGDAEPATLLVPNEDLRIVDDSWEVAGLCGTGSKDIVVEDAFVPFHRIHLHSDGYRCDSPGNRVNGGPLYKLPFGQVFIRAVNTAAIGALKRLTDEVAAYAARRVSPFGGRSSDNPATQLAIGEALAAVHEMKALMHHNFALLEQYVADGEEIPLQYRLMFKYQAAQVSTRAADISARLYRTVGGTGLFLDQPFARIVADIAAARQHQFNQDFPYATNLGSVAMGNPNTDHFI